MRKALARAPVAFLDRVLPKDVVTALSRITFPDLPQVRVRGPLQGLAGEVMRRMAPSGMGDGPLASWLAADVASLAGAYAAVAGTREVAVRLEGIDGDACRILHVDAIRLRLLTTYAGPGTEYLMPGMAGTEAPLRMSAGDVAVIRGSKGLPPGVEGLVHRSPSLAGTGRHRLFLSVDEGV